MFRFKLVFVLRFGASVFGVYISGQDDRLHIRINQSLMERWDDGQQMRN
jgi:hypothetical protein